MPNVTEDGIKRGFFIRRLIFMLFVPFVLICILIARLIYLQIIDYDNFKNRAENNSIKLQVIPPMRGNFLDRNNVKLTNNRRSYDVFLYKINGKNSIDDDSLNNVIEILNLSLEQQKKMNRQLVINKNQRIINIISNLNWEELTSIETNSHKLKNVSIEEGSVREYLYPEETGHITGYVSNPNEKDIMQFSKFLSRDILLNPNFKVGRNGLEMILNLVLMGKSGYKKIEVNANNVPIREIERKSPEAANDLRLTIDINLQRYIFGKMEGKRGGVVVLNAKTGEILAMVSTPSFNGNKFVNGVSSGYWNSLLNDPRKPLYNKTITGLYAPGSTFKPVVAIAALESGVWDDKKKFTCPGKIILGKTEFSCWARHGHGSLNLIEALERSCNVFFINLGLVTGINKIFEVASSLGIGEDYDIKLSEFKKGILPNSDWKYKSYRDVWVKGDTANTSIGQGFLLVNPLQMAVVVSRIANNGYPIKPYILYDDMEKRSYNQIIFNLAPMFKSESVDAVKRGRYEVVNGKHGTASWIKFKNRDKYGIGGKTGTSQVIATNFREEMERDADGLQEHFRNHGWFIGFAPFDDPKYGIAVLIEHGGGGSVSAAPVGIDVLKYMIDNGI
jgi:penicillin-binding protein 2